VVVDSTGKRLHDDDLTFPAAWKLKEQLAGGRKVVSPRIEQAEAVPKPKPVVVTSHAGVPPGVPAIGPPAAGAAYHADDDDDLPEVAAGAIADEELDDMLKDIG
jgi:hypothetical protein